MKQRLLSILLLVAMAVQGRWTPASASPDGRAPQSDPTAKHSADISGDQKFSLKFELNGNVSNETSNVVDRGYVWDAYVFYVGSGTVDVSITGDYLEDAPAGYSLVNRTVSLAVGEGSHENYHSEEVLEFQNKTGAGPLSTSTSLNLVYIYPTSGLWHLNVIINATDQLEDDMSHEISYRYSSRSWSVTLEVLKKITGYFMETGRYPQVKVSEYPGDGMPNYQFDLINESPQKRISLVPEGQRTDENGIAQFSAVASLSDFDSAAEITDSFSIHLGGQDFSPPIPISLPFCQVYDKQGEVSVDSGDILAPGTTIVFGHVSGSWTPRVELWFADGKMVTVEILDDRAAGSSVTIGPDYINGQTGAFLFNGSGIPPSNDPNARNWKWAAITMRTAVGVGMSLLTPWGLAARATISVGLFLIQHYAGYPMMAAPLIPASGLANGDYPGQAMNVEMYLMGDGSSLLENYGAPIYVQEDGQPKGDILPSSTGMTVTEQVSPVYGILSPLPGIIQPLGITPAHGSTITNTVGDIEITLPFGFSWLPAGETRVRLNGVLITRSLQGTPFSLGANKINASFTSHGTLAGLGVSEFTVVGGGAPAKPKALGAIPGQTKTILTWDASPEKDLAGYRVYRKPTSGGSATLISGGLVSDTVFIDDSPPAETRVWYSVSAVNQALQESQLSDEASAMTTSSANVSAPGQVSGFSIQPGEIQNTLVFTATGNQGWVWRLQRKTSESGSYENLALVNQSPYLDRQVGSGVSYWYQIIPIGKDALTGPVRQAGPVTLQDLTPAAPQGITIEIYRDQVTVEWNPSPETDIDGYKIYRMDVYQVISLVTPAPITSTVYTETIPLGSVFTYRVAAVDGTGHESAPSVWVQAAARLPNTPVSITKVTKALGTFLIPGSVTTDPLQDTYALGSHVRLQAVPAANFEFLEWAGDASGTISPVDLTLVDNMWVTATFQVKGLPGGLPASTLAGGKSEGYQDGPGADALFYLPSGVAVDTIGNVYVADTGNHRIRKITPQGVVSTLAPQAQFSSPRGIAVDADGHVYVADSLNNRIRKIAPDGQVTNLAGTGYRGWADGPGETATFTSPGSLALDSAGNVYVADTENSIIRKISPEGYVTTIAGTPTYTGYKDGNRNDAWFSLPEGIAVSPDGNLIYISDTMNHAIRRLDMQTGQVTTLAGSPTNGTQDGSGSGAAFHQPARLSMDGQGTLFVADSWNHRIRKVTPAGEVSTLSGVVAGYNEAPVALFYVPNATAVDGQGNIYVADEDNYCIRKILTRAKTLLTPEAGGTLTLLTSTGVVTATFPAGAVTEPLTLTMTVGDPGMLKLSGVSFTLEAVNSTGLTVTQFTQPFALTLHYGNYASSHLFEDTLKLEYRAGSSGAWVEIPATLDEQTNTLWATLDHLSQFALTGDLRNFSIYLPLVRR